MAASNKVTLVLSSKDVTCTKVEVPNKATRMLRKIVPYILEEELASPVDSLFFALADKVQDQKVSVRIIDKDYLESVLAAFEKAEISLNAIYTDIDLINQPEEGMNLAVSGDKCMTIDSSGHRWSCDTQDYPWLIQKELGAIEEDALPIAIPLDIYSQQETDELEHQLPVGRFAVSHHAVESFHQFLLTQKNSAINLLQAEYEVKQESSETTQFLTKVASIIGLVLLAHLLYQGVNIYTLSEQKEQLDKQQYTLYKQAYPGSKKVKKPFKEMSKRVKSTGSSGGSGNFHELLLSTTEQLKDLEKIYPTNISYDAAKNELRLDVIASDLVVLDQFADELKKAGHQVDKSSETQRGDGYSSRLTVSK